MTHVIRKDSKSFLQGVARCPTWVLHAWKKLEKVAANRCLYQVLFSVNGRAQKLGICASELRKFSSQSCLHRVRAARESCFDSFRLFDSRFELDKHCCCFRLGLWCLTVLELKRSCPLFSVAEAADLSPDCCQVSLQKLVVLEERRVVVASFDKSFCVAQKTSHASFQRGKVV